MSKYFDEGMLLEIARHEAAAAAGNRGGGDGDEDMMM